MNFGRVTCPSLLFALSVIVFVAGSASAQISVESIGIDPLKRQEFRCVRYVDSSLNEIEIFSTQSGKEVLLSRKAAERRVKKSNSTLQKQKKNVKETLRDLRKERRRLIGSGIPTANKVDKLLRLNAKIDKLGQRLTLISANIGAVRELRQAVIDCGKESKTVNGSIQLIQGSWVSSTGKTRFYAVLDFVTSLPHGSSVCATFTGNSEPIPGIGVNAIADGVARRLVLLSRRCLAGEKFIGSGQEDVCYEEAPGSGYFLATAGGELAPGSCGSVTPQSCSLEESVRLLTERLSQITLVNVEPYDPAKC